MMIALTVIFMLLTYYVPFFSLLGVFVCGVPMACLAARNGLKVTLPALAGTAAVAFLFTGNIFSVIYIILMSVLPGAISGYVLGSGKSFFTALFAVCLAVCAGAMFEYIVIDRVMADGGLMKMADEMVNQFEPVMNEMLKMLPQGSGGADLKSAVSASLDTLKSVFRLLFPALVIISSMLVGYAILMFSAFVMKRIGMKNIHAVPFYMLKAPKRLSIVAVIMFLLFFFSKAETLRWALFANVTLVLYSIVGTCGMSLLDFKLRQKIPKTGVRVLIYVLVFLFGGVLMSFAANLLIIAGIFDSMRDYRGIDAQKDSVI